MTSLLTGAGFLAGAVMLAGLGGGRLDIAAIGLLALIATSLFASLSNDRATG